MKAILGDLFNLVYIPSYLPENVQVLLSDSRGLWIRIIEDEDDDDQHEDCFVTEDAVAHGLELPDEESLDRIRDRRVFQDLVCLAILRSIHCFLKRI